VWIEAENCFNLHVVNAFDDPTDPDKVVLLTVRTQTPNLVGLTTGTQQHRRPPTHETCSTPGHSALHRWVLDVRSRKVVSSRPVMKRTTYTPDNALPPNCEWTVINPRFTCQPHRFVWAASMSSADITWSLLGFDRVARYDIETGDRVVFQPELRGGGQNIVGDLSFAPGDGPEEESGSVLFTVTDKTLLCTELFVLDAKTMQLQCKVRIPVRVPLGFHTNFKPGG